MRSTRTRVQAAAIVLLTSALITVGLAPPATSDTGTKAECTALFPTDDRAYIDCRLDGPPATPTPTPSPTVESPVPTPSTSPEESTPPPSTPSPTPSASPTPSSNATSSPAWAPTTSAITVSSVTVNWPAYTEAASYLVGRDGQDQGGSGPWSTTDPSTARSRVFDKLLANTTYTFTVKPSNGPAVTVTAKTLATSTPSATPTPTPTPSASPSTSSPSPTVSDPSDPTPGGLSGASSGSAADGTLAKWRGSQVEIIGTWVNDPALYPFGPKLSGCGGCGEFQNWNGPADVGIHPMTWRGWQSEADGGNDAFWTSMFRNLKTLRGSKGTTYVRPWYEYNGDWFDSSVRTSADRTNFLRAFARIDAIQNREFPEAKLMLGTASSYRAASGAVADLYPASGVDVLSIDFYNNYPWCTTTACFNDKIENGAGPNSLADLVRVAKAKGDPVMISEWSNQGKPQSASTGGGGESPQFIRDWHSWLTANAGTGPGQVLGEVLFDLWPDQYELFDGTSASKVQPKTAAEYAAKF